MELARAERRNAALEVEAIDGATCGRAGLGEQVDDGAVARADELDALDRGGRFVADLEERIARARGGSAARRSTRERSAHLDAVEGHVEPGSDAVGRKSVATLQRGVDRLAIEGLDEEAREPALARGDLREAGMTVVGVAAADEAEAGPVEQYVPDEVARDGAADRRGRVEGLAHAVDGGDLGDGLELGVRRVMPVGRDRIAGGVVGEGQDGLPAQGRPELVGAVGREGEGGVDLERVVEGEDVAMAVEPARPLVAGERHEAAGRMPGLREGEDLGLSFRGLVEGLDAPVVVVGEGDDVEAGDVPGIAEVGVGGAGAVGITRVAVEIAEDEAARRAAHDDRRELGLEAGEGAFAANMKAEGALGGRCDELDTMGIARGDFALLAPEAPSGHGARAIEGCELERPARAAVRTRRRIGPARAVARVVDQGEREREGLAGRDLRRAEGDELGGLARDDVDGDRRRNPRAPAVGVAVEPEADLGPDLRITIDLRPRCAGAVDELELLARREGAALDAERTGHLGRNEARDGAGRLRRRARSQRRRRVARGSGILRLDLGPEPERIGQQEEAPAVGDARRTDLEDESEALAAARAQDGPLPGLRVVRSGPGLTGSAARVARAARMIPTPDGLDRLEPESTGEVGGRVDELLLGEGGGVDLEVGVRGEGWMLRVPVGGELEPRRVGEDRRSIGGRGGGRVLGRAAGARARVFTPVASGVRAEAERQGEENRGALLPEGGEAQAGQALFLRTSC